MPAIQVARTDTFEQQRVKINEIGSQVFSITQGGSDLATGNLRLGDGTITIPALSFISDSQLGLYKSDSSTLGFVSGNKDVFEYSTNFVNLFSDLKFTKRSLLSSGLFVSNSGQNYDPGSYTDISSIGGSGSFGTFDIVVTAYEGSILSYSEIYTSGTFQNVVLIGGSGSGSTINFTVSELEGNITNSGSNYTQGVYSVNLQGSLSGSGAQADIFVSPSGIVVQVTITTSGSGYQVGDILTASSLELGGGSGFEYTVSSSPGKLENINFTDKGSNYQVGDILSLPEPINGISGTLKSEVTGIAVTLNSSSNTFTVLDTTGILQGMLVTTEEGSTGSVFPGTIVTFVDTGTNTITIDQNPTLDGESSLRFTSEGILTEISVNSTSGILEGYLVTVTSGSGILNPNTIVTGVDENNNLITINSTPLLAGSATLQFTPPFGYVTPNPWRYEIDTIGSLESISVNNSGYGYDVGDTLTVNPLDLVQPITYFVSVLPVTKIFFSLSNISYSSIVPGDVIEYTPEGLPNALEFIVYKVIPTENNLYIQSIFIAQTGSLESEANITVQRTNLSYEVSSFANTNKFFIDSGSGPEMTPDLELYAGNTYQFDISDSTNSGHPFLLSKFADGIWSPSFFTFTTTLSTGSKNIIVNDTSGILPGMLVSISSESTGDGSVSNNTLVTNVIDSTTIELSNFPIASGEADIEISGLEYSDGVSKTSSIVRLNAIFSTPPLYYYCGIHQNMGGDDNEEGVITINQNNPKVFGSGLTVSVNTIESENNILFDIVNGKLELNDIQSTDSSFDSVEVENNLNSGTIQTTSIQTNSVTAQGQLNLVGTSVRSNANFLIGNTVTINQTSGAITTSGSIKSSFGFNSNDRLAIVNETISSTNANDIILQPFSNRTVRVVGTSSITIPSGTTAERPPDGIRRNGSIRFNTDTNQYEGYNNATTSWSSLGGVRDIDGNTYILAELTAGANDNTLWFFNDNNNTLRLSTQSLDFRSVKRISSGRLGLPTFTNWAANVPVTAGQYLKYRNNLYEVTTSGVTATSGNEPTHTSGSQPNGTAVLDWYSLAVSPLEFTEIEELRIGPNKDCPLVVNAEIKLSNNTISTLVEDLIISPNPGKKVVVNSTTHLAIPSGNENQKSTATAIAGSIRYNTTISQFEGYSGSNWSSLGGVRDVDGNTYIIPETSPGANENILYFYNNNVNTLQLTTTTLDFTNIDTITTSGLSNLALDTPLVTLNSNDTTIDNRELTRTFISTSKQYLDLGLSSGLVVDPVLRLDDQGDVYLNIGFGTGSFNGVKIFDSELKEFELADYAVKTETFTLTKGTAETSAKILYELSTAKGCQVSVVSKSSSGKKSLTSYNIIDNGSDIFHNEFGSLNTSADGFTASFDITPSNETRITVTLSDDHTNGDIIEFTLITQVYK